MRYKIYFLSFTLLGAYCAETSAQSVADNIHVIGDSYGHKITRDGSFSTGEAVTPQSAWGRDNVTGALYFYDGTSVGDGNPISKDHRVVGTDKVFMKGAFLIGNGDPQLVASLEKYSDSYLHGISWDGSRICGIVANPRDYNMDEYDPDLQTMMYLPIYCDVDPATGIPGDPVFLPTPNKDFFGTVPSYCTAVWISDDGKRILGQVIDNSGFYIYPIVYRQLENGSWDYILPSEELFNPNNLEIPKYPVPTMKAPQAEDYIGNPENKALFILLSDQYTATAGESTDPYLMLNPATNGDRALMTQQEWDDYQKALADYKNYMDNEFEAQLNKYYLEYNNFMSQSTSFLQSSMAMNNAGTLISQTKLVTVREGLVPVTYQIPVLFDLEKNTYQIIGDDTTTMQISQILPDGTLICVTPKPGPSTPDLTPQHSYVVAPGTKEFIPIEDYIKASNPDVYAWYQEYLYHDVEVSLNKTKKMTVTGLVSVSDDFTAMSAGVDMWAWDYETGDYITYFVTGMKSPLAAVDQITNDFSANGGVKVYNLQGAKVLDSPDKAAVKTLPSGVYIINGKKTLVR